MPLTKGTVSNVLHLARQLLRALHRIWDWFGEQHTLLLLAMCLLESQHE